MRILVLLLTMSLATSVFAGGLTEDLWQLIESAPVRTGGVITIEDIEKMSNSQKRFMLIMLSCTSGAPASVRIEQTGTSFTINTTC